MRGRPRPELLHMDDVVGLVIRLIERVIANNQSHVGTAFNADIKRVHGQLGAMTEAGLLYDGEQEVIERCLREFDQWNDYTRDTVSVILRHLYPRYLAGPPDWAEMARQRRLMYEIEVVIT